MSDTTLSPNDACRQVIRKADRAVLSTLLADSGEPYGALVLAACQQDGTPLLFLSDLAEHTKNLKEDARASLLYDDTAGLTDPLTGLRVSLQGRLEVIKDDLIKTRYVRRHPSARLYAAFADFNLYRLVPERAHLVAGFGRIHWVDDVLFHGNCQTLEEAEAEILAHMNQDHLDTIALYANKILNLEGVGWFLTGVDPEGCDIRRGGDVARLPFEQPVFTPDDIRKAFVGLAHKARAS